MVDTLVARCSDDFYPLDPASHTSHVAICAYNSIFMGAIIQVIMPASCPSRTPILS